VQRRPKHGWVRRWRTRHRLAKEKLACESRADLIGDRFFGQEGTKSRPNPEAQNLRAIRLGWPRCAF
jgi:hypothetical protein